jgi:hypothetical protein
MDEAVRMAESDGFLCKTRGNRMQGDSKKRRERMAFVNHGSGIADYICGPLHQMNDDGSFNC